MSKRKSEIGIGYRAYEEVRRLFPGRKMVYVARLLGSAPRLTYTWKDGACPSAMFLSRLHYLGADVIYILTGERSNHGQAL